MIRMMLQYIQDKLEEKGADNPVVKVEYNVEHFLTRSPGHSLCLQVLLLVSGEVCQVHQQVLNSTQNL